MATEPQSTDIPTVPLRTPMFDGPNFTALCGNLSRTWIIFFERKLKAVASAIADALSAGPFIRTFLIYDSTVGNNVAPNVVSFGATIGQASIVRRVTGTLRKAVTVDQVIRWNVVYPDGTVRIIGTFTLPYTTPLDKAVAFTSFDWATLPDLGVLIPDIVSSDGTGDDNTVSAWTVEWVGRGAGLATAPGLASAGAYDTGTTYAKGDVVTSGGSGWISLAAANTGNDPATSPLWWTLLVSIGATGPVSSVGLTMPAEFSVAGSPVTSSGTLAVSKATQTANEVYAGPATGSAAAPGFRALVAADVPAIAEAGVTGLVTDLAAKVTHSAGALTVDLPMFGAGTADSKVGTKSGNTNEVATVSGSLTSGHIIVADASGNLVDGGAPGGGSGTVTHTAGALTADLPVFGAGTADIKVGTKSGNTDEVATVSGALTAGNVVVADANGNLVDAGVSPGGGAGGSGSLISDGPFASAPATCAVGDLYFPTDSLYTVARCTTTNVWTWFINGYLVTPPTTSGAWVNQNSATISGTNGGIYIADPAATPDTQNYKAYLYSAPGASFTLKAILYPNLVNANFANGGICLRETASGKGLIFHLFSEGGSYHLAAAYQASFASGASSVTIFDTGWALDQPVPLVLKIVVGSTDITFYSTNQHNPIQPMQLLGTVAKTTAFTTAPDQFGLSINARNATYDAGIWCASLEAA